MPRFLRQFGLRTLLLFCLMAAIGAGLWRWHMDWIEQQHKLAAHITDTGGRVSWTPWGPGWLHRTFGSRYFSNLTSVHWEHRRLKEEDLALLGQITTLEELYIPGNGMVDDQLAFLDNLSRIRKLALWNNRFTNAAMERIGRLKNLEVIDIHNTRIDERGLDALRGHPHLHTLRHYMRFTDDGIDHLATIPNLFQGVINGVSLNENSMRQLRDQLSFNQLNLIEPRCENWSDYLVDHPTLTRLTVDHAKMTDPQLQALLLPNRLEHLALNWVPVTKEGLPMANQVDKLSSLTLVFTDVSPVDFLEIFGPRATFVSLHDNSIVLNDQSFGRQFRWQGESPQELAAGLQHCQKVQSLQVFNAPTSLGKWQFLANMTKLQSLAVTNYPYPLLLQYAEQLTNLDNLMVIDVKNLSVDSLASLKGLSLTSLNLQKTPINSEHVKAIAAFEQLKMLNLGQSKITDEDIQQLASLKLLASLEINNCQNLTDDAFKTIGSFGKLQTLWADGVPVTDEGLKYLHAMPLLSQVRLGSAGITPKGVGELRNSLPNASSISYSNWPQRFNRGPFRAINPQDIVPVPAIR